MNTGMKRKLAVLMAAAAAAGGIISLQAAEPVVYQLDPVNVTAFAYEKKDLDTPADVSVITGEELKKTGASNVAQALKYTPGIMVSQMGPHDQSWITGNTGVSLRGISGGTLVMIDGVPVSWNGVSHLDMIPTEAVKKVEVVKGGGTVLYGSSAYGGVINVITDKTGTGKVSIGAGNDGKRKGAFSAGNDQFRLWYAYDGMGETGPMTAYTTSKKVDGTSYRYQTGFGDSKKHAAGMSYHFNDALTAGYMHTEKKYAIDYLNVNDGQSLQHFDYEDKEDFLNLHYDKNGLEGTAFYQRRHIDNPDYYTFATKGIGREWEKSTQQYYGMDVKNRWRVGNHDVALLGALYKRETFVDENVKFKSSSSDVKPYARFGTYQSNNYALYGSYEHDFGGDLTGIASFRWDTYRTDRGNYDAFLPQVQFNKKLSDRDSVYVNVGKSFRMPNMRQLYYGSSMIVANPDLKPERGINYEAGYKHIDGKGTWKAAVFRTELKNMIYSRDLGNGTSQPDNAAEYRNQGVELSYTAAINDNFSWYAGGLYGHPQKKDAAKTGAVSPWKDTFSRWQFTSGMTWKTEKDEAALQLAWTGDRTSTTSSVKNLDILLNSSFYYAHHFDKALSASLSIDNIFDKDNISDSGYYGEGRNYMVTVEYSF